MNRHLRQCKAAHEKISYPNIKKGLKTIVFRPFI